MPSFDPSGQDPLPQDLVRGLASGRGILFLGPGISRDAGLNVREELNEAIRSALRRNIPVQEADDLETFLEQAPPSEVAQALQDQIGREAYLHFLQSHIRHRDIPPPPLLYALRALPFRLVFTTNFDRLIERAFEHPLDDRIDADVVIPSPGDDAIPEPGDRPVLVKLFGDMERPDSLILTTDDYETYFRVRPDLVAQLKNLVELGPAVFVGYRLRDPEFRRLYSQIGALVARAHKRAYAILDTFNRFETNWWGQRVLTVLAPHDHRGVESVLRRLTRQLQAKSHPGTDIESEQSGMAATSKPISPWNLAPILDAQLKAMTRSWLIPGTRGPIDLRTGYVPQTLDPEGGPGQERESRLPALLSDDDPDVFAQLRAPLTLDASSVIEQTPRVLVHAPSGAGKTTLLLHLLQIRSDAAIEAGDRTLVIYMPVREIGANPDLTVVDLLVDHLAALAQEEHREDIENAVMDALLEGRSLLLLDGLDEVEADQEAGVLTRLTTLIQDCPRVRMVLTCRSSALEPEKLPEELELSLYELSPLTSEQQYAFIKDRMRGKPFAAQVLISMLRTGLSPWAQRLASNPLHLALICLQFYEEGKFPNNRAALYESFMSISLRQRPTEGKNVLYAYDYELIFRNIAFHAMIHPQEPLSEAIILRLAQEEIARAGITPMVSEGANALALEDIRDIVSGSGILVGPGQQGTYQFRLNSIREYLTARKVRALEQSERAELIQTHARDRRWAGVWRIHSAMTADSTSLLETLEPCLQDTRRPLIRCFGDARRVQPTWLKGRIDASGIDKELGLLMSRIREQLESHEKLELFREILQRDEESFRSSQRRSNTRALYVALNGLVKMTEEEREFAREAADIIAAWQGTPEVEPEDSGWPFEMVEVAGGTFLMGNPESGISRYVNVSSFEMGRSPVTIADYRLFNPQYTLNGLPNQREFSKTDHPTIDVSWYDAWVCACWFGGRLPTEAEWEKAAGWDPEKQAKRVYPWGNEWDAKRCNTLETWRQTGHTTGVRRYGKRGESPYACWDMAGNVLEWTQSRGVGTLERRVLKGGGWQSSALGVQPVSSVWLRPSYTGLGVGFRLCRSKK